MTMMKTAILNRWRSIDVSQVPIPALEEDEARVRILYCGICGSDIHVYNGAHPTARPPVPLGHEMMGIVDQINTHLPVDYNLGDRVVIHSDSCGKCDLCLTGAANQCLKVGIKRQPTAGDSEYMIGHIRNLVRIPDCLSDKAATLLEPFACAVRTTDRAGIKTGDTVLVIGGGTIGFVSALTARAAGATRVIMSVKHQNRIELAKRYGFDVVDAADDPLAEILRMTGGKGVDATIEASCSPSGVQISTEATAVEGTIVMLAVGMEPRPVFDIGSVALKELTIIGSRAHTIVDMRRAARLMEQLNSQVDLEAMISDVIPLEKIEEGFRMMAEHRNAGKILVRMT